MSAPNSHPVEVVFVSSHSRLGGSEKVLADLLAVLPPGTAAAIVALEEGPLVELLRARGAPVTVLPTGASLVALARSALALARHLRRARPRVVHGNGVKAALVSSAAARLAHPWRPAPVLWMKHDVSLDGPLGRLLAARCAVVVGVSREVLGGLGGAGRQVVVHPGVQMDAVQAAEDAVTFRRGLDVPGPVVTVIGRMDPAKGHAELLEALPDVLASAPDATALLVGPDDAQHPGTRERLASRMRELGVARNVRLLPHEPSASVIAASDVVCIPTVPRPDGSGREGFGLVAAEALALGVPVVGYDIGATGEVLDGCGVLVPAGDRAGLARAIGQLLTDADRRGDLAACGRARAGDLTLERTASRLLDLYEEVAR